MKNKYILALDQGTTSTRALIINRQGRIISKEQEQLSPIYPQSGWVEHDPEDIWKTAQNVISGAITKANLSAENIAAIGITNQRETTVVWDKYSGKPVYNAIVWQCRRTASICDKLKKNNLENIFREKTGLLLDPYFSGTKIKWILDNVEGVRKKAENSDLLFGTIDSWLIWKLTDGKTHVTDYTNASRTLLFNIHTLEWDKDLMEILEIPASMLPRVCNSSEKYTMTDKNIFLDREIPISGIAGDQQAATFAQGCYRKGMAKTTYGTGAFMLMNTGSEAVESENGLLTTIAWGIEDKVTYALEGSIFNAGATIQWLKEGLTLIDDEADSEYFAKKVDNTDGVYLVPAFTGIGAPYWEPEARGTLVGLTRRSNKNHIIRAALESLVYQSKDLIKAMCEDSGFDLKELYVDGGVSNNDFLLQFLADMTGKCVIRPENIETTALGSAYLAGLATGYWENREELKKNIRSDIKFSSKINNSVREKLYKGWSQAVEAAIAWCEKQK